MHGMSKELIKAELEMSMINMDQPWQVAERLERKGFDRDDFAFDMLERMQQQFDLLKEEVNNLLS